jgi:alpha-2-macroglobulin
MRATFIWFLAALLVGCPDDKKTHVEPKPVPKVEPAAPKVPKSLDELHPVIAPVPESSTAPEKVVVHFAYPIVPGENTAIDERTVLVIDPAVSGTLRFSSASTLEFLPTAPFAPDTDYRVRLESVQMGDHAVKGKIEKVFHTPKFGFLRADLAAVEPAKKRVAVDMVFTGPVLADDVEKHAELRIDAKVQARIERTAKNNVVRATISEVVPGRGKWIELSMAAGVRSLDRTATATAAQTRIRIAAGEPIKIYGAAVREGASGYYVQVVCNDGAIPKPTMYFWDDITHNSYELSRRCVLEEEDARASIHFEPKVDFTISPMRGGFRVLGKFRRGSYTMRIDQDARSVDGGVLLSSFVHSFSVPARSPQVGFVSQGRYLPKSAWRRLAVRHLNLASATLRIRHVPPENLVFWLSSESEAADERNSTLVLEHAIELKADPDVLATTWVDVSQILKRAPTGVLELELTGSGIEKPARARLLLTDINLVAKMEDSGRVRAFAVGIHDNQPLAGVEVKQVVPSGRVVSTCVTAWDGACELGALPAKTLDRTPPFAILATIGEDLTYLTYDELRTPIAEDAVHGRRYTAESPYSIAIYSDRGVYRPGDTAHVAAIVRGKDTLAPDSGMPIVFELFDPRKKATRRILEETNDAGMVSFDISFADFATTGRYRLVAEVAKRQIGEIGFNVEEFVPERMRVKASVLPEEMFVEDDARVRIEAAYLFGGSADGSPFEVSCELHPAEFRPKQNAQWEYGVWTSRAIAPLPLGKATGVLREGGTGEVQCPELTGRGRFAGTGRVVADVSVFESGSGRSTHETASALVHPENFYLGLKSNASEVKAGEQLTVDGIVVDWAGEKIKTLREVKLALHRIERERDWVYDEAEGYWNHREYQRLVLEAEKTVPVKDGRFSHTFTVAEEGGAFIVRADAERARTDLELEGSGGFYWYEGWGEGEDRTPRPQRPASLEIRAPAQVDVAEKAKVHFVSPFAGRALITLETDRVIEREWLDAPAGEVEWSFEIDRFVPNAYVSVLVLKDPHADSALSFVPERAFGVRSIRVKPAEFTRPLSINVPEEVRSNGKLDVKLDLGELEEPTFVTVAVVDEGILSLTKFASPNPFDSIFDPRALGVTTFETIGWNLLLPAGGASQTTGGDGGGGLDRVQQVKPVALWSGMVEVPANGKVDIPFAVPQYRGQLRVMVVAAGTKRMAHGDAKVLVRDPLVLQTTLPRFLIESDRVRVPVFVTNVSGARQTVKVSVRSEGLEAEDGIENPIEIAGSREKSKAIADGASETFLFDLIAKAHVGAAKLIVTAEDGTHVSTESLDVPFAPNAPKSRVVKRIELKEGRTDITAELAGWLPTTERTTFWVTANPYGESFDHLKYLIRYPYGCVEQTVSSSRPLLFIGKFLPSIDPRATLGVGVDELIMHGVNRVLAMQTPDGGFAYWPGGNEPTPWGTAYALHFLIDAKKAGYPISEGNLEDALSWVERKLDEPINDNRFDEIHARPYLHYVASLSGRGRKAEMLKAIDEIEGHKRSEQSAEELYLLKAGVFAMGDRSFEADLKALDLSPVREERYNGWTFWSDRRTRGFMLSTFVDLFGRDPDGERMATLVAESLRGRRSAWYTTQELVWGITGLGKYVGDVAKDFEPPVLWMGKKSVEATVAEGNERTWSIPRASERGKVAIEMKKSDRPLYLVLSSEGVKKNAEWQVGGDGLRITREYRRPDGEPIGLGDGSLKLGDVIYAIVTFENTTTAHMQNLALVDRFPAGWEIENPRLGRSQAIDWLDKNQLWEPDHLEIRDDRIEVFGALRPKDAKKVVYALRAVSAGKFAMPPAEAEAMYDPTFWARAAGGSVVIKGPWD